MEKIIHISVLLFGFILTGWSQNQNSQDGLKIICKYDRTDEIEERGRQHNVVEVKNGKMIGYVNHRCCVVDSVDNIIIPDHYDTIDQLGHLFIACQGKKYNLFDKKGNIILKGYESIFGKDSIIVIENDRNKWGVCDLEGKILLPCEYSDIYTGLNSHIIIKNNKWGVADHSGKIIIPVEYELIYDLSEDFYVVMKNDLMGIIDRNNQLVLDFKYAYITSLQNNTATTCECEKVVILENKSKIEKYKKKGYVVLNEVGSPKTLCKSPEYKQLKLENGLINIY
jgi:hypothetical protein